ncbi:hypothetical protein [Cerasicoccus maritimus]|uniref:hypothetical protein n=1 Tax=Cerasicoccus maritimus TaxID=490089 RepID=UPI00285278C6|nr:hypothetical protein [Cerasicoccus maritimus]
MNFKRLHLMLACSILMLGIRAESRQIEVNCSTNVSLQQAISDGQKVAERNAGWEVMLGGGQSMAPYFGNGSVLLVDEAPMSKLKPGMMVVFEDEAGDLVGHWLMRNEDGRWITRGVNNRRDDPGSLNAHNYRGVIFGVLNSAGEDPAGLAYAAKCGIPRVLGKTR